MTRRHLVVLTALMITLGVGLAGGLRGGSVSAQPTAIECPPVATPAAAPAAASPAVAAGAAFPADGGELTVFAAASLTDAFGQIGSDLEAANSALSISFNFAGSQLLVTQLNEGAEADLFASADEAQMEAAIGNGSIAGEPVTFVRNRLVIVVPADNPAGLASAADLGMAGLRLVLAQPEVPVGRYARESICALARDAGAGFVERVAANVVSAEEDVRDVLAKVQLGEADAGIVYRSDAIGAGDQVRTIEMADAGNVVATYPIAAVAGGDRALADAFIAYVLGPEGQATLAAFGFEPVA